jgi:hypothetical protein
VAIREEAAADRDRSAAHRDTAADERDSAAEHRSQGRAGRLDSRADREASAGDRLSSEQDRLFAALDREFAEFDRREAGREHDEHDAGDTAGWTEAGRRRELAAVLRDEAATRRDELAAHRTSLALTRDREAALRDRNADMMDALADLRDRAALERDRAAAARDVAAIHRDLLALERERNALSALQAPTRRLGLLVIEAETDRQLASVDRLQAAMDRLAAMQDRVVKVAATAIVGADPRTGVYSAGDGLFALQREIEVADAGGTTLRAALVELDAVTGSEERGVGSVVDGLRAVLGHRDLVLRWSGAQILVALVGDSHPAELEAMAMTLGIDHFVLVTRTDGQDLDEFVAAVVAAAAEPAAL